MKNYAVIQDGIVVNAVIADDDWVALQTDTLVEYAFDAPAYIGGRYADGKFYRPGAEELDGEPGTEFVD